MDHAQIERQQTIDRYVRGQLAPEEQREFEEHFFACDRCFEEIQTAERFAAGIRYAAEACLRHSGATSRIKSQLDMIRPPGFGRAQAVTFAMAAAVVAVSMYRMTRLRAELTQEFHKRDEIVVNTRQDGGRAQEMPIPDRRRSSDPGVPAGPSAQLAQAEPNIPLVRLEPSRGGAVNHLNMHASARTLVLWIEPGSKTAFSSFQLKIHSGEHHVEQTVPDLKKNRYGGLAVSLSAERFPGGKYLVQLYGEAEERLTLLQAYTLQILRD